MAEDKAGRSSRLPVSAKTMDRVVIIVSLVWGGSFVTDMIVTTYDPPTGLHQVMMLLIGFLVAGRSQAEKTDADKTKEKEVTKDE